MATTVVGAAGTAAVVTGGTAAVLTVFAVAVLGWVTAAAWVRGEPPSPSLRDTAASARVTGESTGAAGLSLIEVRRAVAVACGGVATDRTVAREVTLPDDATEWALAVLVVPLC
jgi:hypothetical protein